MKSAQGQLLMLLAISQPTGACYDTCFDSQNSCVGVRDYRGM
jgi:hypothetical protein